MMIIMITIHTYNNVITITIYIYIYIHISLSLYIYIERERYTCCACLSVFVSNMVCGGGDVSVRMLQIDRERGREI